MDNHAELDSHPDDSRPDELTLHTDNALVFSDKTFAELGVDADLLTGLNALGFTKATEVQKQCFAPVLAGKDVVVQSKTGSGKTGAFGLPILQRLTPAKDKRPRMLALCPTRELANQVEAELSGFGQSKGLRTVAIYGGVGFGKQNDALSAGVDIVVGTPGRVMDQIEQKNLDLSAVEALVLDEADEMLSMGFWEDVLWIIKRLPKDRQTLLFSATLPFAIERAARSFLREPERIDLSGERMSAEGITHFIYNSNEKLPKPRNLLFIMEVERPESAIVFCNTRSDVELISQYLGNQGYDIEALSGDLSQNQRERVLGAIKGGRIRFMVATDVAARGIDIRNLSHVFNYSLPEDAEVYIHRSGRTGRIGRKGVAVSLLGGAEEQTCTVLKRDYNVNFIPKQLPDSKVVAQMRNERIVNNLIELAEQAEVTQHLSTAEAVLSSDKNKVVVAFLIKQFLSRANRPSLLGDDKPQAQAQTPRKEAPRERRPEPAREPRREARPANHEVQNDSEQDDAAARPKKIFVNLGQADGVERGQLVGILAALSGAPAEHIQEEDVRRTSSFIRVEPASVEAVLAANGKDHNGKALLIERARRSR